MISGIFQEDEQFINWLCVGNVYISTNIVIVK